MPRKVSEETKQAMINDYLADKSLTTTDINIKYRVNNSYAWTLFDERGIKIRKNRSKWQRKYHINENYFDRIDTQEKAYFLGLMYADGNTTKTHNNVRIDLQERDVDILKKFKKAIEYEGPLRYVIVKKPEGNTKIQNQYSLSMVNQRLAKKIKLLGCIPNKSLILKFPTEKQVPKHLVRHFIRGMMDGDGYFSKYYIKINNTPKMQVNLVSTVMFLKKFQKIVKKELGINCFMCKRHKERDTTTRQLFISGTNQATKFLDWIYKGSKVHLNRKYEKYRKIKDEEKNSSL